MCRRFDPGSAHTISAANHKVCGTYAYRLFDLALTLRFSGETDVICLPPCRPLSASTQVPTQEASVNTQSFGPPLPYEGFPLRPHRNGQWFKSVWNRRTKRSEQFYFGSWSDDPKGERALKDPQSGWLVRRDAIKAGIDNVNVQATPSDLILGELMARFLAHKKAKVDTGELSKTTLGDYLSEICSFVAFCKPGTPANGLRPEHFTAYMSSLVNERKLGRLARKRVRAYVTAFLRFGATNGWISMPNTGSDWVAPATDPDSLRQARFRAGQKDFSSRIVTGREVNRLLARANPTFRAMILLGVNCGLGPADLGRLRWDMIDLERRRISFPRPKTGVLRVGCLWKNTRRALDRVSKLKHNRLAIQRDGQAALVFVTRKGLPYYREREVHREIEINGTKAKKLVGVAVDNAISITFGRMARQLDLDGVTFYRLRHTFKTLAKRARDGEALDLMMGHRDTATGKVYDHETIGWKRVRDVSAVVRRRLWRCSQSCERQLS